MSMLPNVLPTSGNVFPGFPPPVYTCPYHLFNIDDDSSKEPTETKMAFPLDDPFYSFANCCFDFTPNCPEPNQLLNNPDHLFAYSPMEQQPPTAEPTLGGEIPPGEAPSPFLPFGSQASTPHNRRMIFPYTHKKTKGPGSKSTSSSANSPSLASPPMHDEPLLLYRFFEFYCTNCEQCWLSPLFRAKNGCYCRNCHHFILPRGIRHSFTPYLGNQVAYGKYCCHLCNRGWSSYKSLSNRPDQCFACGTMVYPYYQIAHSVLFQKIHKKDDDVNAKSAFLKSFLLTKSSGPADYDNNSAGIGAVTGRQQQRPRRNPRQQSHPRKITSISGFHPVSGVSTPKQTVTSKKRLHCPNNVSVVRHSAQQVRRQFHLKNCFSEPTIVNNTRGMMEVAELGKIQEK